MPQNHNHSIFALKGSMLTVTVLYLFELDLPQLDKQLQQQVQQAPQLFENLPIIIDISQLHPHRPTVSLDLAELKQLLLQYGMCPLALRGLNEERLIVKHPDSLPLLMQTNLHKKTAVSPTPSACESATIIQQNVRSGQQVFAKQGDLIVLGSVSHGAEILAKGNIHVYGTLNGRAFAGTSGDLYARIFCQKLKAELLSVAGQYLVREDIDEQWINKIVQIYLDNEQLTVQHF